MKSLNVLIADDEPALLKALARMLVRGGHTAHRAADAASAIELLGEHPIDAAFVDHNMPGGGAAVLQVLLDRPDFDGPAVLMTGQDVQDPSLPQLPRVIRLQKPFRVEELLRILEPGSG